MSLYAILKWVHVLAAITALGANVTYGVWLALAARDERSLVFALRGISFLDRRLANPGYVVLLISGLLLVWVGDLRLTIPWILIALILYVLTAVVGIVAYSPALRRQIALAENPGRTSVEYRRAASRGTQLGILTSVLVVAIVFLMVVKPPLW